MALDIGDTIPDLTLAATGGSDLRLRDCIGRKLVLYFYPKDNTPGCTQEGQDFAALYGDFQAAGIEVLGVSRDSIRSHEKFVCAYSFPFKLLSDPDETLCQSLGVIVEKSLYGRKYLGVDRSTFLFDAQGSLQQTWRAVKVKNHAAAVLAAARAL